MTRKPVLVLLVTGQNTHAAEVGSRVALCGAVGTAVTGEVHSSFDFTCTRCVPLVQDALGLTALNDPGNVGFVVVDEEES